jgi:hypothetical protein
MLPPEMNGTKNSSLYTSVINKEKFLSHRSLLITFRQCNDYIDFDVSLCAQSEL